ncbi:MAG: hypothetical protein AVDCRST_MAG29-1604, partial [uncultured Nocardioidaceae bacterium]
DPQHPARGARMARQQDDVRGSVAALCVPARARFRPVSRL